MTREEAIEKLQKQKAEYLEEWVDYSGVAEAYDMATEALKADTMSREDTVTLNSPISIQTDVVAVVRCKDCKWYKKIVEKSKSGLCHYDLVARCLYDEDFCSHGERREE